VTVNNLHASGVHVFTNDLLPWPEGKVCTGRSLEVGKLDNRDGCCWISNQLPAVDEKVGV